MNLKEKYLNTPAGIPGSVEVEGWGTVRLRALSLAQLEKAQQAEKTDPVRGLVLLVLFGVCDQDGKRVFSDDDADAVKDSFPVPTLKIVTEAIVKHNRLSADDVSEAKKD